MYEETPLAPHGYFMGERLLKKEEPRVILNGTVKYAPGPLLIAPKDRSDSYADFFVYTSNIVSTTGLKLPDEFPAHAEMPTLCLPQRMVLRVCWQDHLEEYFPIMAALWAGRLMRGEIAPRAVASVVHDILVLLLKADCKEWTEALRPHLPEHWVKAGKP